MSTPPFAKLRPTPLPFSNPNTILVIVSLAHAVNHAYSTLMPLIYPLVVSEFRLSISQIGLMVGVASAVSGLLQMAFSYLSRFIARRVLLGGGQIIMALSSAATGLASNFNLFFLGNLFARIGGSPQHPVGTSILSDHFETERRGFALSAHISGGNVGTVAVPLIGTFMIASFGWRSALFVYAAVTALVGLMLIFLTDETRSLNANNSAQSPTSSRNTFDDIRKILSDRNVQLIFIVSTIAAGGRGLGVVITYVPLYLNNVLKLDQTYAGVLFTLLLTGSVIGPLFFGKVSDVRGRRGVLILTYSLATVLTLIFTLANGTDLLLPIILLSMGIFVYAESPLLQAFLADATLFLNRDLAFGLYFTVAFGVGSFWASLMGWIIDSFGFASGFYVMAASYVASALLLLLTRQVNRVREK